MNRDRDAEQLVPTEELTAAGDEAPAEELSPAEELTLGVDPDRADAVAERVVELGGAVLERLPAIGVLSVRVPAPDVAELARIDGVLHVERERTFQLPPPDAGVQ